MEASVKVMNSYDYCHFEVTLSKEVETLNDVDELRKDAQCLVDKAISQYKKSKEYAHYRFNRKEERKNLEREVARIKDKIPESERNAEHKAKIKALEDETYWSEYDYRYEDDETDLPF